MMKRLLFFLVFVLIISPDAFAQLDCEETTTYNCDEEYLKGSDKPKLFFSFDAPISFEVETVSHIKPSYYVLKQQEENEMLAYLSFGYLMNSDGLKEEDQKSWLEQVYQSVLNAGYQNPEHHYTTIDFDGIHCIALDAKGTFDALGPFDGEYLYRMISVPYDENHALLLVFISKDKDGSNTHDKITTDSCLATIWHSFRLNNNK